LRWGTGAPPWPYRVLSWLKDRAGLPPHDA
jgi:hypothetical protein